MRFAILLLLSVFSSTTFGQLADFAAINFEKADSVAMRYEGYELYNLKELADRLTSSLPTEAEKFRAIYRWVCENIGYDYALYRKNLYQKNSHKTPEAIQSWNKTFSKQVFTALLHRKKTVCTGYAYLIKELAHHAGIGCVIVDGYGRTTQANVNGSGKANHSWNAVRLNNKWYLCDATWSAGVYDTQRGAYLKEFNDIYFLPDPSIFLRNHYPLDTRWTLLTTRNASLTSFLSGPLIYKNAFTFQVQPVSPTTFHVPLSKGEKARFQFYSPSMDIKQLTLSIQYAGTTEVTPSEEFSNPPTNGRYMIDHLFSSRGNYTVHVLANFQYVMTYQVQVD